MSTTRKEAGGLRGVFIGASKGIGYHALYHYLNSDTTNTATLVLRKPELMDDDEVMGPYVKEGRVKVVEGDATDAEVIRRAMQGDVDFVLTSVGASPSLTIWGLHIDQPQVCTLATQALITVLSEKADKGEGVPRVVAVSSMGIGEHHAKIPLPMRMIMITISKLTRHSKLLYSWLLAKPHLDKLTLEYLLLRASTHFPTPTSPLDIPPASFIPTSEITSSRADFIPVVTIVRPAMFTGSYDPPTPSTDAGGSEGRPAGMKVGEEVQVYTTNRAEVGEFISKECLPPNKEWVNRLPVVGH